MRQSKIKEFTLCAMFIALISVGAFINIPIPLVPFTLQFLFTLLAGVALGSKFGSAAVLIYILMGLLGLPVFAQGGGLAYIVKPSFGYLIGFVLSTYVCGYLCEKKTDITFGYALKVNLIALMIVYVIGAVYFYFISNYLLGVSMSVSSVLLYCVVLAIPGDLIICFVVAYITKRIQPLLKRGN